MNFNKEISKCKDCKNYANPNRFSTAKKPYVNFYVEEKWKPQLVKVLFIAESPPWQGYFYDQKTGNNQICLRTEVLNHLNLTSLTEFRTKGYYLIDAIKCRLKKPKGQKKVPKEVLRICSKKFLETEINELKPHTIFVLGTSAKEALWRIKGFEILRNHKVTEGYDGQFSGFRVILGVYPGKRTRKKYKDQIKTAFSKLR